MKYFDPIGLKKIEDTHTHTHTHICMSHDRWLTGNVQLKMEEGTTTWQFFLKAVDDTVGKMGWWLHEGLSEI